MFVSRLAPTPSGFLHLGNVLNFLITQKITLKNNGKLILRIDDSDQSRRRDEYLEDIFEVIKWLEIKIDHGPKNRKDFESHFSQSRLFHEIRAFLAQNKNANLFSCHCSRKEILEKSPSGAYPGTCYGASDLIFNEKHSIRLKSNAHFKMSDHPHQIHASQIDPILWKKDQTPSYHLTSIWDDMALGVTHIIRGMDLLDSSFTQIEIAKRLNLNSFESIKFYHHPLIINKTGEKLSKSTLANQTNHKSIIDQFNNKEQLIEAIKENLKDPDKWDDLEVSIH